jgi:hypothetical protein
MDWTTLGAAFLGGGFGGAIPAAVSAIQLRRDKTQALQARRWVDAEIIADARKLLTDLEPQRRTLNVNPTPGVEDDLWKDLNQRKEQVDRQLMLLAAGHPSKAVATSATELGLALVWLAQQTQFAVREVLANRDFLMLVDAAQERYKTAETALDKLTTAAEYAATPKRRLFRRSPPPALEGPPRKT